jgi:hypothetical protein
MIPCFFVWNDLNLRADCARFFGNDRTDAIHRGFIVRRRFGFDQTPEEGPCIHDSPKGFGNPFSEIETTK